LLHRYDIILQNVKPRGKSSKAISKMSHYVTELAKDGVAFDGAYQAKS